MMLSSFLKNTILLAICRSSHISIKLSGTALLKINFKLTPSQALSTVIPFSLLMINSNQYWTARLDPRTIDLPIT
jgi:hypothetical protein